MDDEKTQEEIEHDYWELKPLIDWLVEQDTGDEEDESD